MDFEEVLKSFELTVAQIEGIKSKMSAEQIYLTQEENLSERYGKVKRQRDEARAQLREAQSKMTNLSELEALETKLDILNRSTKLEKILSKAGVKEKDMDYVLNYKLAGGKELPLNEKGDFQEINQLLKDWAQQFPDYFSTPTIAKKGYQIIDRSLDEGLTESFDPFEEKMAKYQK